MSRKFLTSVDLNKNELQNARIQNLATAPVSPVLGQLYFDTTSNAEYIWNGTAWRPTDASKLTDNSVPLSALATDPLARANHTGTQSAITISDLATTVQAYSLDQFASPTAAVSMNSQNITGLADPVNPQDAATKAYADAAAAGIDAKASCRVGTTGNISLTGLQTVDGVALSAGDRVLVNAQTNASENGIYVAAVGAWPRATDCDSSAEYTSQAFVFIEEGTTLGGSQWKVSTTGTIVVGTTNVTWAQFSATASFTAGDGLVQVGNTISVGAGTGISVAGSAVSVDTALVARKHTELIGDGTSTSIAVTHSFGNQWVNAQVYEVSSSAQVECDIVATSANTTTFSFAVAPATNAIRVVITG